MADLAHGELKRQRIYERLRAGYGAEDIRILDGIAETDTRAEIDALRRCGLIHRFYQVHGTKD